jgi:Tfp pilus assembly protein PilV
MRQRIVPSPCGQSGFSLVELMMASLVLITGVLATMTMIDGANGRITETRGREAATNLAREVIEAARAIPYPEVTPEDIERLLQEQPGLADASSAPGWNIRRRNQTYTVHASSCIVDDDNTRDGLGDHTGLGTFCTDASAQGTADRNADDYKRVSIQIDRVRGTKTITVKQTAVINNPGSQFAPSVRSLTPTVPALTSPYSVTTPATTSITFTARVTPRATYVDWFVDNIKQVGGATRGTADDWTFSWPIPATVVDGLYLIGAQGFSATDQSGTEKAVSVVLNRFKPARPATFRGGRNGAAGLEFEWTPSADRDVTGYRVYRVVGTAPATTDTLVCSTAVTDPLPTSCRAADVAGDKNYYVVAVAPACCGVAPPAREESVRPTMAQTLLVTANVAPNPPQALTAVRTNDGVSEVVTLTWQVPAAPAGGEASDAIQYYRIYRDGTAIANRYGQAGAAALSFADSSAGTASHHYWVTTVDTHMAESTLADGGIR